ncbi:polysaccharide pyruvyl transferase WcaK-like protein [Leeuwenhoekiella aestuarii]|uniref:polysaccharide pyruvyl transferase family protein n=1 Tax=Leeuwenhoekiella aestuarii TaxID=2249426 RepID=UPI000FFE9A9A|nr:polysaccharide pyruvyl transferase family protein [Leeuwenhoekiella aestuarii]RXG12928.1 polysaccharide pyruvyl transferase WcaK-like protein [Leeuwenhoekiella aestuarii]
MGNKKKQIAIVWANPYNKNLGVGALAYSALALLNDVLQEDNIEADLHFFGTSQVGQDHIEVNGKKIHFSTVYGMNFFKLKSLIKLVLFPNRFKTSRILSYDLIFDIAEGDSFTDIYGDKRFWNILNSKRFFSLLGRKQVLLPQTIGPFNKEVHEKAAFKAMQKLEMVISRDRQSYAYTQKFLPESMLAESIDVAFYMPYDRQFFSTDKIHVGLNISGLLWNGGYTKDNQFNLQSDYKKLILNFLDYFTALDSVQVHIVPHVVPKDHPVEDDYQVSEAIIKDYPQAILAPRFENPIEAKGYIGGLDFFSGGRMHSCIAAYATGVPVVPMAYSRKFNGLFVDTLAYNYMGDCVNTDEQQVMNEILDGFNDRETLKAAVQKGLSEIVAPRLTELKKILSLVVKKSL